MGGPHTANGVMAWCFLTPVKQKAEACRGTCGPARGTVGKRGSDRNA